MPRSPEWKKVEKLIEEAKFEEARQAVAAIREQAQKADNGEDWTEALIKEVQLTSAQHGYETSVRFLREQSWPQDLLSQATLELFYAQSLMTYLSQYSWEINKREKVESKGTVDLKSWTKEQIYLEAQKAYARLWPIRAQLGEQPVRALAPLLTPNDYPDGIRGTLRDALGYLWVELLANTQAWTPAQSNEVFRLDLKKLLATDGSDREIKLEDPAPHPIEKLVAVLADLERWHGQSGHTEAALEAQRSAEIRRELARQEELRRQRAAQVDISRRGGAVCSAAPGPNRTVVAQAPPPHPADPAPFSRLTARFRAHLLAWGVRSNSQAPS